MRGGAAGMSRGQPHSKTCRNEDGVGRRCRGLKRLGFKAHYPDMRLFKNPRGKCAGEPEPDEAIPVALLDLSKRYDLYCSTPSEDRLYEDVRIVAIRTLERKKNEYATALLGGYLEIEAQDGARMMVPHIRMYMICEHGSKPAYKVLRVRKGDGCW